jgi:hypothetical protein
MLKSFAHLRDLGWAQTQLAGLSAGIVHIEDPLGMPLAAQALGTASGMEGGALEEGTAQDIAAMIQGGSKFIPFLDGALTFHLYR